MKNIRRQRPTLRIIAALLAIWTFTLLLSGCAKAVSAENGVEQSAAVLAEGTPENAPVSTEGTPENAFYAVDVGKGDALIVRAGEKTFLIDAGKRVRWGRVQTALQTLGITRLDAVFLTHTDKDHMGGLMPLALSEIEIGAWYASAYFCEPKKEKKHPAVKAAALRGQTVRFLKAGDTAEGIFTVLAPFQLNEEDEDENSLVLRVTLEGVTLLLAGDMENIEEQELVNSGADLHCTVLKVPNHGDSDACSEAFLKRTAPKLAVISTNPEEKPGTPDELLLEALAEAEIEVKRTDLCAGVIKITCKNGRAEASEFALPAATMPSGLSLTVSDEKTERITVQNGGNTAVDLTGCYFITQKEENVFLFPAGTVLAPGAQLSVGTLSTADKTDLVWEEKNVFSNKAEDGLLLFTPCGELILSYFIGD